VLGRVFDHIEQAWSVPRALGVVGVNLCAIGGELSIPRGLQSP
jgi:hypothetical protein